MSTPEYRDTRAVRFMLAALTSDVDTAEALLAEPVELALGLAEVALRLSRDLYGEAGEDGLDAIRAAYRGSVAMAEVRDHLWALETTEGEDQP